MPSNIPRPRFWWLPPAVSVALAVALGIQFVQLCGGPRGDFPNHWEFGRRLATGEAIYAGGLNVVYPPLWSLAHAPLTLLPRHAAQLAVFPLLLAALALLLWTLRQLTRQSFPVSRAAAGVTAAVAVLLAGRFLFRDMAECGVNLLLVALAWLAIYLWTCRREGLGGACLGLAIALKCTPLAFLGYFVWKRQWKMSLATAAFAALFTLAPALWMGAGPYAEAMSLWASYARRGLTQHDPHVGVLGDEKVQNLSLRPALAALVAPRSHEAHAASAWPLALSAAAAGSVIKFALAIVALGVAWQFRRPVAERRSRAVLWECAIISLAMLLYSPITWTQHCVGVLPALYLLVLTAQCSPRQMPRWAWPVVAGYVLAILILNRAVLGREATLAMLSYHVPAWSLVGLFCVALACHRRAVASTPQDMLADLRPPCILPANRLPTTG